MLDLNTMRAAYNAEQTAVDAYGRVFTVKKLKPSEENRIFQMIGDNLSRFVYANIARVAQVRGVHNPDGTFVAPMFPKNMGEAESYMDAWGDAGLRAINEALAKFDEKDTNGDLITEDAAIKNS